LEGLIALLIVVAVLVVVDELGYAILEWEWATRSPQA
jgi:hypothetical protein